MQLKKTTRNSRTPLAMLVAAGAIAASSYASASTQSSCPRSLDVDREAPATANDYADAQGPAVSYSGPRLRVLHMGPSGEKRDISIMIVC